MGMDEPTRKPSAETHGGESFSVLLEKRRHL